MESFFWEKAAGGSCQDDSGLLFRKRGLFSGEKPPEAAAYLAPGLFCIETPNYMLKTQKIAILAAEKPRVRNFAGGKSPCGHGDTSPRIC